MLDWTPIDQDPPHDVELLLWLKEEVGSKTPIGQVIAKYTNTNMGPIWTEKSVSGNINTGLRQDLITHYKLLEDGPNGKRSTTGEDDTRRFFPGVGG